jgi:ribosomal protein S18 acetylase RimI-like enzyme
MDFTIEGPFLKQSSVCVPILRTLPDWFGIEAAILDYEREIELLPTFLAHADGSVSGFLSSKLHNPYSAEIYVMAVRPDTHRSGIGRALVATAETHARKQGVEYMQVKTLGPSRPNKDYACTRAFYEAVGYRPLEEFARIWDEDNPCLIMIKKLLI